MHAAVVCTPNDGLWVWIERQYFCAYVHVMLVTYEEGAKGESVWCRLFE